MTIHAYTSFSFSYLNRARVLAATLRQHHPDWTLWAVVTDAAPDTMPMDWTSEGFDRVIFSNIIQRMQGMSLFSPSFFIP